jgi:5-methylcytosine-specific restriction endonuclease McrA
MRMSEIVVGRTVASICVVCEKPFSYQAGFGSGRYRRTCTDECSRRRMEQQQAGYRRDGRYAGRRYGRPGYDAEYWAAKPPKDFICGICQSPFQSKQAQAAYCSQTCVAIGISRALQERSKERTHRPCEKCGVPFRPYRPNRDQRRRGVYQRFCSEECGLGKGRRGLVQKLRPSTGFDPIAVLERDHWTCHLCGIKTPKELRGTTDDRAPEVDHIIPWSCGGAHTMENAACACRKCNLKKGAKPLGQLRMFG